MKGLFLITGVGLGNATRCHALMEELSADCALELMASGNAYHYFNRLGKWPPGQLEQLPYRLSGELMRNFLRNRKTVHQKIKDKKFDFIVMDSEYSLAGSRVEPTIFSVNSARGTNRETAPLISRKNLPQFAVEQADVLMQKLMPDFIIRPDWVPESHLSGNIFTVPPLVRRGLRSHTVNPGTLTIGIMLSGSATSSDFIAFRSAAGISGARFIQLGGMPDVPENFSWEAPESASVDFLTRIDMLVTNAGHTTLSEAFAAHIPTLSLPLPGHFEQTVNAHAFREKGFGDTCSHAEIGTVLPRFISRYREFMSNFDNVSEIKSGASLAAEFIRGNYR